jgi:transposase InsO family protein
LQRVAMDIMGPLPLSNQKNRFMLVVADYFTKWTEAYPLPSQEAEVVAKAFVEGWVCRLGTPGVVHTDQGRNFQSSMFREVLKLLGVHQTRTCAFHPQSDGMVERANRTIEALLATVVQKDQRDWD